MMDYTSLEISKEIYERLGWEGDCLEKGKLLPEKEGFQYEWIQRYSLGYLLRKLPSRQDPDFGEEVMYYPHVVWMGDSALAGYFDLDGSLWGDWSEVADTPEDAAGKLVLALAEQGIIGKAI